MLKGDNMIILLTLMLLILWIRIHIWSEKECHVSYSIRMWLRLKEQRRLHILNTNTETTGIHTVKNIVGVANVR